MLSIKNRIKRLEENTGAGECRSNCNLIIVVGEGKRQSGLCPICMKKPIVLIVPTLEADGSFGKRVESEIDGLNIGKVYAGFDYDRV